MHTAIHRPRAESARHVLRGLWCGGGLIRSELVLSRIASRCRPNQPSRPAPSWRAARTCPEPTPLARVSRSWRSACGAQGRHRTHIIARPRRITARPPTRLSRRRDVLRWSGLSGLTSRSAPAIWPHQARVHVSAAGDLHITALTRRVVEQDKTALAAARTMPCGHAAAEGGPEGVSTDGVRRICVPLRGSTPTAQRTGDRGPRRTSWRRGPAQLLQGVGSLRTTLAGAAGCMPAADAA